MKDCAGCKNPDQAADGRRRLPGKGVAKRQRHAHHQERQQNEMYVHALSKVHDLRDHQPGHATRIFISC